MEENVNLPKGDLYEIRVKGHLPADLSDWPEGLAITYEAGNVTVISARGVDQAAIDGLLAKIRDLNLKPISVSRIGPKGFTLWPL